VEVDFGTIAAILDEGLLIRERYSRRSRKMIVATVSFQPAVDPYCQEQIKKGQGTGARVVAIADAKMWVSQEPAFMRRWRLTTAYRRRERTAGRTCFRRSAIISARTRFERDRLSRAETSSHRDWPEPGRTAEAVSHRTSARWRNRWTRKTAPKGTAK